MFVVELSLGLLVGAVLPPYLVEQKRVRFIAVVLGMVVAGVIILSLPAQLSLRVGVILGIFLGLSLSITVLGREDAKTTNRPSEPPTPDFTEHTP